MKRSEDFIFNDVIYKRFPYRNDGKKNYFISKDRIYLHRAIWEFYKGEIKKGWHIHHKDGNALNNSIENLDCLTPKQHCKAHSDLAKIDPSKDIYESRRKWQRSEEGLRHHSNLAKLNWRNNKPIKLKCEICGCDHEKYKMSNVLKTTCKKCLIAKRNKPIYIPKIPKTKTVKCSICYSETIQRTKKEKKFCSKNCKTISRRLDGIDNIERKCLMCDKEFIINKYSRTQTCSDFCRGRFISSSMKSGGSYPELRIRQL